jgi:hypothetical protein
MGGKNMNKVRIETSFKIDSRLDADEVFEALSGSLFDADTSSSSLQDADVFANSHYFTLAIVGVGDTIDSAVMSATDAIRAAIEASGVKALSLA